MRTRRMGLPTSRVQVHMLLLSPKVALGKLLHLSEPQLPSLGNGRIVLGTWPAARAKEVSG